MMIEHPDGLKRHSRWAWVYTFHASRLAPFDESYIEPQEITIEDVEETPKLV